MSRDAAPVRIIQGTAKHRVDTRVFARNIHESWCMQKGCKFFGKPAAQGVCHTTKTFAGDDFAFYDRLEKHVEAHLVHLRKMLAKMSPAARTRHMEAEIGCALMNQWSTLDECIRLRAENARLRVARGKWGRS